jgi:hypothetical protein
LNQGDNGKKGKYVMEKCFVCEEKVGPTGISSTTLQSVVHATKICQIKDLHFMVLLRTKMAMKYVFV